MERILAVDTNIAVYEKQTAEWAKYGIGVQRVETMNGAINRLARGDEFLLVVINEDTIMDYMAKLPVLRDVTDIPIFIVSSTFTIENKIRAMNLGADVYDQYIPHAKQNVLVTLETLKAQKRWAKNPSAHMEILTGGEIILSQSRRKVFVKDAEISLARKEFDILRYLMENNGRVMTHKQLMREIWGENYTEKDTDVLWRTINRLRVKLSKAPPANEYIKIERGVGYVFNPK